jgi:hypothetical protein
MQPAIEPPNDESTQRACASGRHRWRTAQFHAGVAPILKTIQALQGRCSRKRCRLLSANHRHGTRLSSDFFALPGIPEPDVSLKVDSRARSE